MDKNHNQHTHGGGMGNGFLLGVIVGAALVFLFATKKGKKILKMLSENGFEGIAELTDMLSEDEDEFEENYTSEGEVGESVAAKPKRFFRGIKR